MRCHRLSPRLLGSTTLALALFAAGCGVPGVTPRAKLALTPAAAPLTRPLLSGHIRLAERRVQASADLFRNAPMVILLNDQAGVTRASGIATADGAFTIYQSTQPYDFIDGAYYHLVAIKRLNTDDGRVMTLRTLLKRVGHDWNSLTGPTPVLSLETTALAQLATERALSYDRVMSALDDTGSALRQDVGGQNICTDVTTSELEQRRDEVAAKLGADIDPGGPRLVIEGDYTILDQRGLDAIAAVTEVKGCLTIVGNPNDPQGISEVRLPFLKKVGALYLMGSIGSVAGLSALSEIGHSHAILLERELSQYAPGSVVLELNERLGSLEGLENLREVPGDLVLMAPMVANLDTLRNLRSIGRNLVLNNMANMMGTQAGWEQLTELPGDLVVDCPLTPRLDFLSHLAHIGGSLEVAARSGYVVPADLATPAPHPLGGLENLETIGGSLRFQNNLHLSELPAWTKLRSIGQELLIDNEPELTTLDLGALETIGQTLTVSNNPALSSLSAAQLRSVSGDLRFSSNPQLTPALINALKDALMTFGGNLVID